MKVYLNKLTRRPIKKPLIKIETKLIRKRTLRTSSLDPLLEKIYASRQSERSRNQPKINSTKSKSKQRQLFNKTEDSSAISQVLPDIYTQEAQTSKNRKSINPQEDKLHSLIDSFFEKNPEKKRIHPKLRRLSTLEIMPSKRVQENINYTNHIENFCAKDLADYQNNVEKHLGIEKIRLDNDKKYRMRLKSDN